MHWKVVSASSCGVISVTLSTTTALPTDLVPDSTDPFSIECHGDLVLVVEDSFNPRYRSRVPTDLEVGVKQLERNGRARDRVVTTTGTQEPDQQLNRQACCYTRPYVETT
jgi:hypothetical protein